MNLTEKEQALYDAIQRGMDSPGSGWLHEVTPFGNDHVTAGVLGALVEKALVVSEEVREPGMPTAFWVALAERLEPADG